MPFAGYDNFDDCVAKNRDKADPKAYCAEVMRRTEGKKQVWVDFNALGWEEAGQILVMEDGLWLGDTVLLYDGDHNSMEGTVIVLTDYGAIVSVKPETWIAGGLT